MNFSLPFTKKKEEKVYYFCLYITDSFISGFVLDTSNGTETILSEKRRPLTANFDKFLEDTDALISDLELQAKVSLSKTIFFLHSTMIDPASHDIKEPYKSYIKKISKELELEPLGYIDVEEAIEDYIHRKSIMNCLIVELNKKEIGLFMYQGGAKMHSAYTPRTPDTATDLQNAISAIPGSQVIPSKMIIYGDFDNTQVVSQIAQYQWNPKLFVQHPTIEAIKLPDLYMALAHSFAKELGASAESDEQEAEAPEQEEQEPTASSFGFMMGEDIANSGVMRPPESASLQTNINKPRKNYSSVFTPFLSSVGAFFKPSSSPKTPRSSKGMPKGAIIAILIVVLIGGGFVAYEYFFHKVMLKVYVQSKDLDKKFELTLPVSNDAQSSETSLIKYVSKLNFSDEKNTTGSREIGEKAKGEVTVHNFDNSERTLERGTEIKYKDLIFTLDTDAKVASSSGITSDGTKQSGKATVEVTASEIGEEYNVAKGTQFSVDSLAQSLFVAIANETFTGGSKKKVSTVSKADLDSLELAVEKKAKDESSKVLGAKISNDEVLISDLSEVDIADSTYSKELGEEASKVGIEASSEITYYTINKKHLLKTLQEELGKESSQDYLLDENSITYKIEQVSHEDEKAILTVNTNANLYKKVDTDQMKKSITLKPIASLTEVLKDRYPVENVEVENTTVSFPLFNSWSPLFKQNIQIVTAAN